MDTEQEDQEGPIGPRQVVRVVGQANRAVRHMGVGQTTWTLFLFFIILFCVVGFFLLRFYVIRVILLSDVLISYVGIFSTVK